MPFCECMAWTQRRVPFKHTPFRRKPNNERMGLCQSIGPRGGCTFGVFVSLESIVLVEDSVARRRKVARCATAAPHEGLRSAPFDPCLMGDVPVARRYHDREGWKRRILTFSVLLVTVRYDDQWRPIGSRFVKHRGPSRQFCVNTKGPLFMSARICTI